MAVLSSVVWIGLISESCRILKGSRSWGSPRDLLAAGRWPGGNLKEHGIDPYHDFKKLLYGETHDEVVYAVRDGLVDVGTVRTNTLEQLSAEGKINFQDYFVFPRLYDPQLQTPYLCTTREYPDWPMAKTKETPDDLAEKVAVALLQMKADSPAALAAGCAGWTIPLELPAGHGMHDGLADRSLQGSGQDYHRQYSA